MRSATSIAVVFSLASSAVCSAASGAGGASPAEHPMPDAFERPDRVDHHPLAPVAGDANPPGEVRCFYYKEYTVKELDEGEKGDGAISVTPFPMGARRPSCGKQDDPAEKVLAGGRGQYFGGARGNFVYVSGPDRSDGGTPFTVYNGPTGKALYRDRIAVDSPTIFSVDASVLTLKYRRGVGTQCSILSGGETCWTRLARETHLPAAIATLPAPIAACEKGYAEFYRSGGQQDRTLPSGVSYDVTLTLDEFGKARILTRGDLSCGPNLMRF